MSWTISIPSSSLEFEDAHQKSSFMNFSSPGFLEITSYGWIIFVVYWIYAGLKTKKTIRRESSMARVIYLILMILAFELIYAHAFSRGFLANRWIDDTRFKDQAGLSISLLGIAFAITARRWLGSNWSGAVTVKKDHELIRTGPYAITRHPIYTGMFFGLIGAALVLGEMRGIIAVILFFLSIQMKMSTEEKFMQENFREYADYKLKTKKLIPFVY